ncbi:MAG TPA: isoprenylcysteine carboxylmethyltransferase family protein [Anaerolineae bacterium]|jgi:protein-S-isoprenylcysteine O-methyltransferase Ste14|nr:isoprenylcysteine carboxylmethyltransferase family protein [Anaerolineae bacterium]
MQIIPDLNLELANQWILLTIYFVVFIVFVFRLSKEKREWLFEDPKQMMHGWKKLTLRAGQLLAFIIIILLCFTRLPVKILGFEFIGMVLYLTGVFLVPLSLHYFGKAPLDQPVLDGPYRYSRNPQWVGLFMVLFGLAILADSILLVILVTLVGLSYHIQILGEEEICRAKYGASYEEHLKTVPRYLIFK